MALTQDIRVTFQLRKQASENEGSIKIEDLTNYKTGTSYTNGQAVKVYFKVLNPNGSYVVAGTSYAEHINSTIQADGNVEDTAIFASASLGVGGIVSEVVNFTFIPGEYTVEMYTQVNSADVYTHTETFTLDYVRPVPSLSNKVKCANATLDLTDNTSYSFTGSTVAITRAQSASYPSGVSIADITGSGSTMTMSNPLYSGVVRSTVDTDVTYDFESSLSQKIKITDTVVGGQDVEVACQFVGSDAEKCLQGLDNKYRKALANNPVLADRLFKTLSRASQLLSLYDKARESDSTKAAQFFNEIKTITNCTEECTGCSKTGPQIVTSIGGSSASDITINGSSSVSVVESPSNTFTVTANAANIIGSIEDNRVVSSDGITTTNATVSGVKTYTLKPTVSNSSLDMFLTLVTGTTNTGASVTKTSAQIFGTDFSISPTLAVENTSLAKNFYVDITSFFSGTASADANYKVTVDFQKSHLLIEPIISLTTDAKITIAFVDRRTGLLLSRNGINELQNEGATVSSELVIKIKR